VWLTGVIMQISIITMGLGVGTLLAGLFGMNVRDPPRDFNTDVLRKPLAYLAVKIELRRTQFRVLYHGRSVRRVRRNLLHVCHSKVWTLYHVCSQIPSFSLTSWSLPGYIRFAKWGHYQITRRHLLEHRGYRFLYVVGQRTIGRDIYMT
jgi:hypothetical protein